jgi:polysaccharide biosynthesis protein PslH
LSDPRILLLAPRQPYPPTRGDQRRVAHVAEELGRRAEVRVLAFGDAAADGTTRFASPEQPPPSGGADAGSSERPSHGRFSEELPRSQPADAVSSAAPAIAVRAIQRSPLSTLTANLRAPDPRLPLQVRLYLDARMRAAVDAELARLRPHVLHVTLARMAPYARAAPASTHVHVDFVDSLSLNMRSRAHSSALPLRAALLAEARLMARYEDRVAAVAGSSSVVSQADREASPGLGRAVVLPNGVDVEQFAWSDPAERPPRLLFFGNLGYFHNVEPARFVSAEVLPRVRAQAPEATLRLVGARPAATLRQLARSPGVELAADVPSMVDELHGAAVAVLPMFSGSGIKNKVLEAFAAGTPVVTNRAGIEGVEGAVPDEHYLEREGADALAEACLELLRDADRRRALALAARELVCERYSWGHVAERLLELYGVG